ncbi:hypothetical protein WBJ53_02240 [Spirosoma sp. SC4-14]|uniref:LIC_10190 family membrane protein n=1 Tax=Spirosoma sp. SC4-14 TaxID=3128900 RepID=UPI0030D0FB73
MLTLLFLWILLYFLFSLLGAGLFSLTPRCWPQVLTQTETILAGLIGVVGLLQLVSLALPVNGWSVVALLVLAVFANWYLAGAPFRRAVASLWAATRQPMLWLLLLTILLYAIQRPGNPDSGTYHLPAIRYTERFSVIPGLGNLFSRLAFNSSFFVVGAAVGFTDLMGQTLFPLNGFLLLLFGAYCLQQLNQPNRSAAQLVLLLGFLGLSLFFLIRQVNAPTPDVWATVLSLFVFLLWVNEEEPAPQRRAFLLAALTFTCLTIKLATIPILLFLPFLFYRHRHWIRWQHVGLAIALGCLLVGPWLARNVILSGYLLFPLTEPDLFSVDWKVAKEVATYEQNIITFWARFHIPETEFDPEKLAWPFTKWVSWWWTHWWFWYNWPNRPLFVLATLSPIVAAGQWFYLRKPAHEWLVAYSVAWAGFLFWFLKAPEFRFGYAFIWASALLPVCALVRYTLPQALRIALTSLVLFCLLSYILIRENMLNPELPVSIWLSPEPLSHVYTTLTYRPQRTRSNLTVLVPESPSKSCFDVEQPCTPFFFDDLQLRGSTIEQGFRRHSVFTDSLVTNTSLYK